MTGHPHGTARPPASRSGCGCLAGLLSAFLVVVTAVVLLGVAGSLSQGSATRYPPPVPAPRPSPSSAPPSSPPTAPSEGEQREAAERATARNPLYAERVPERQRCADVDPARLDVGGQRAWARSAVEDCLMPMYAPAHRSASGEALPPPGVEVLPGDRVSTPCGTTTHHDNVAFYCPASETVYLWSHHLDEDQRSVLGSHITLGHEFGHHVQFRAGILRAGRRLGQLEDREREMLRRSELQAECLAGQFLGAVAGGQSGFNGTDFPDRRLSYTDSDTHGAGRNRLRWLGRGYRSTSIGACNTYDAPADEVR